MEEILMKIPIIIIKNNEQMVIENNGDIVIVKKINNNIIHRFFRKLGFKVAKSSKLELDEYSSYVFNCIDGKKNIEEIGFELKKKYGKDAEPIYERLELFLEYLKDTLKWIEYK